jgi:hypothetical protein
MKTIRFAVFAMVAILSISLLSCDKEEEVDTRTYIVINWIRNFNTCQPALAFCLTAEGMSKRTADALQLEEDQAITAPVLKADGSIAMEMEMIYGELSGQAKMLFLEEEHLLIEEDFILSATTMQHAYENSGKTYSGQLAEVVSGLYAIDREGSGVPKSTSRIIITITIKDGVLTIKVTW